MDNIPIKVLDAYNKLDRFNKIVEKVFNEKYGENTVENIIKTNEYNKDIALAYPKSKIAKKYQLLSFVYLDEMNKIFNTYGAEYAKDVLKKLENK